MPNIKYFLTPEARNDLDSIWHYIASDNIVAADKVEFDILSSIENIVEFSSIRHKRPDLTNQNVRFLVHKHYIIIYEQESNPIKIIRILSTFRDLFEIF
jgi:plasmid stabilization system protein ParE